MNEEEEKKRRRRIAAFLLLFCGAAFGLAYYLEHRPRPALPAASAGLKPVPAPPEAAMPAGGYAAVPAAVRDGGVPPPMELSPEVRPAAAEPVPQPAAGAGEAAAQRQQAAQAPEAARAEPAAVPLPLPVAAPLPQPAAEPLPQPAAGVGETAAPPQPAARPPGGAARLYGRIGAGAALSSGRAGSLMPAAALFYPWRRALDIVMQVQQEDWRVPGGAHARSGGWAALGGLRFAPGGGKGGPYGLLTGGYRSAPGRGGAVRSSACAAVELGWRLEFSGGTALNAGLSGAGGGTSYVSAGLALELPLMRAR